MKTNKFNQFFFWANLFGIGVGIAISSHTSDSNAFRSGLICIIVNFIALITNPVTWNLVGFAFRILGRFFKSISNIFYDLSIKLDK